jgi:hypothetical protein
MENEATDKLLALLGEQGGCVPVQIMHTGVAELLHKRYNELVRQRKQARQRACLTAKRFGTSRGKGFAER